MEKLMDLEQRSFLMEQNMKVTGWMGSLIKESALTQMEKFMMEDGKMESPLDKESKYGLMGESMMDSGEMVNLMARGRKYILMVKLRKDIGIKGSL